MGKGVAGCKYYVREIIGQGVKGEMEGREKNLETRVLAKVDDVDCNGGRKNGDRGTNLRHTLSKKPGNLVTD